MYFLSNLKNNKNIIKHNSIIIFLKIHIKNIIKLFMIMNVKNNFLNKFIKILKFNLKFKEKIVF